MKKRAVPIWVFYLVFAALMGSVLVCKIPPLDAPDEAYHFQRAYSLSEGVILANTQTTLPKAVLQFPEIEVIKGDEREVNTFPQLNSSPLMYLPQVVGVGIGRLMSERADVIFRAGRISNLLVWLGLTALGLHLLPVLKNSVAAVVLLPMAVFLAATYSYDAISNGLSFLAIALMLRVHFAQKDKLSGKQYLLFGVLFFLVGQTGKANLLLPLLLLIVPEQCFGTRARKLLTVAGFMVLTWASMASWQLLVNATVGRDFVLYNPHNLDPVVQIKGLIGAPWRALGILWESVRLNYVYYYQTMVGVCGQLDGYLPAWAYWVWAAGAGMVLASESLYPHKLEKWQRVTVFLIGLASVGMVFVALYILYTPLNEAWAWGVQGRYFIPFMPLFVFAIASQLPDHSKAIPLRWAGFGLLGLVLVTSLQFV